MKYEVSGANTNTDFSDLKSSHINILADIGRVFTMIPQRISSNIFNDVVQQRQNVQNLQINNYVFVLNDSSAHKEPSTFNFSKWKFNL